MSAAGVCTQALHEALKLDVIRWQAATYHVGIEHGYEWRNCRACHSTLLRPVARQVQS